MKVGKLWIFLLLGCIPSAAWGAGPTDTEGHTPEMNGATVLVLGISASQTHDSEAPQFDPGSRSAVQARVKALYPTTNVSADNLQAEDLGCRSKACWSRLAAAHHADYIIVGSYTDNSLKYKVQLALVDNQGEFIKVADKDCTQCGETQKQTRLTDAVGLLFQAELTDAPLPSIVPGPSKPSPSCPQYLTFRRGLATGATSALLLTGLVTAVSFSALNGQAYSPSEKFSFGKQQAIFYGLSALPAVGLGLALGLNRPGARADRIRCPASGACPAAEQARTQALSVPATAREAVEQRICLVEPQTKRTFLRGFALGSLGSMVVTSLVSTAVFGSLHGSQYDATRNFSLKEPAIASGVLLGASAVGFLAAWPW